MFKSKNFCHIASNNRNQVKVGVFTYRTTDNLATVSASGYFNERIIDINLHDIIIHEQVDSTDNTKVKYNFLCVTERTLENVGTIVLKSDWQGTIEQAIADLQTYVDTHFVKLDGTSVMTGPLKFRAGSMRGAVAPYLNGVSFWKMDSQGNITNIANLTDSQFSPVTTNSIDLGNTTHTWKDAHVARIITGIINNGYDIAVPVTNSADTLALKSEVDLAANSGRMITDQGVWYAKMYAATVAPSAEDGTNYADFSQVDGQGNPIIVIYSRVSGAWVQDQTITPPADYDGYVSITSKIWDIAEQAGQQGGRILWNHQSKEFTPYPQIVSFENAALTGVPTAPTPTNSSPNNQVATKEYVDNASPSGGYHPDLFDWKWADHILNDVQWLRADTFSWQSGSVYEAAFWDLFYDIQISTYWYLADVGPAYTKSRTPAVGDAVYLNSDLTGQIGTVATYDDVNDAITVGAHTYTFMSNTYVTPTTETVAGYTLTVYTGHSGKKIVGQVDEADVASIYNATGVAWYYVIDLNNKRFKLPRSAYEVNTANLIKAEDLSTIESVTFPYTATKDGVILGCLKYVDGTVGSVSVNGTVIFDSPTKYNGGYLIGWESINIPVKTGDVVTISGFDNGSSRFVEYNKPTTNNILYFYVGEFTQTALENTAGLNASLFNNKVDIDGSNASFVHIVETYSNGTDWYRIYSDNWCEQGGEVAAGSGNQNINLLKPYRDTNYCVSCSLLRNTNGGAYSPTFVKTTNILTLVQDSSTTLTTSAKSWRTAGYIS